MIEVMKWGWWVGASCVAVALTTSTVLAQSSSPWTVEEVRADFARMARAGGHWTTSNERYAASGSGEPDEYHMAFDLTPDGHSIVGCMWGSTGTERSAPFWYFLHAWDPTTGTVLAYQSSPSGAVAVGREQRGPEGAAESIQTLRWPDGSIERVRHLNRAIDAATLDSRSFGSVTGADEEWEERRNYIWVWRASAEATPC